MLEASSFDCKITELTKQGHRRSKEEYLMLSVDNLREESPTHLFWFIPLLIINFSA